MSDDAPLQRLLNKQRKNRAHRPRSMLPLWHMQTNRSRYCIESYVKHSKEVMNVNEQALQGRCNNWKPHSLQCVLHSMTE